MSREWETVQECEQITNVNSEPNLLRQGSISELLSHAINGHVRCLVVTANCTELISLEIQLHDIYYKLE